MKKILKTNPFLLIFFILFLTLILFFNSNFKDKIGSKSLKLFLNKFLKVQANWEKLNLKIFPPKISIENLSFPYGKIEKISISPSFKLAYTKVFIYGMEINLENIKKGEGSKFNLVFLEDLILLKCKIKFKDKEIPMEGHFKDISLFFLKDKGLFNIKEAIIELPEINKLKFSFKSSFQRKEKFLNFKKIFISSNEFKILAKGDFYDFNPSFSFDFNLNGNLNYFLDFLKAGIGGDCNLSGNISYDNDISVNAKGIINKTKFLEKELPPLNVLCKLNSKYLNLELIREKNNAKIMLSFKENLQSEINLKIEKVLLKNILSFFSIPPIKYSKDLKVNGKYNFFGTNIEEGEGFLNFQSYENDLKGKGFLKNFSIENLNININESDFKSSFFAKLPFNSDENFSFSGEINKIQTEKLKNILSFFLPEIPRLKGTTDGSFNIFGTYEDFKISANLKFQDLYYEEIPFGNGEGTIEIYKENLEFKNIFFSYKEGTLEGSGNLKNGIDFSHTRWSFPLPFNLSLDGSGKLLFEPSFFVFGNVEKAELDFFSFDELKFLYDYNGNILNIKKMEGKKGSGIFKLEGVLENNFIFNANISDFPIFDDINISAEIKGSFGENIRLFANGELKYEKLKLFPISFNGSLDKENLEIEMENKNYLKIKCLGFFRNDLNFSIKSNLELLNLSFISGLDLENPIKGGANLSGNLKDINSLKGNLKIEPFNLIYKENNFQILKGITAEIKNGNITTEETAIFHKLAYLELKGQCDFFKKLKLKIKGNADFGDEIVNYFVPQFAYDGMASLDFSIEKTKELKLDGSLNISGYKLSYLPLNFILLNPKGRISIKENKIKIENFEGNSGDGVFSMYGEIILGKNLYPERITLDGESKNLKVSYIQGFTMYLNGKANFFWTEKSKQITGKLTLTKGNFIKEFNLLSELQKIISAEKAEAKFKNFPLINLNLNIDVPNSLKVKNQFLNLICTGKIQILGDISNPIILGNLETLPKSEIYFNGVLYKIEYAKVLMSNPTSFDPLIEMEATSNIRSYLIHLKIKGTLSHLTPQFSSEPYLPEADIISLLATGKVASQESGTWLSGASLLISQQISEELSKRSSSIFGLDRIRIEPVFGQTNITTARITALKQISPNCTLSYTYNPIENQKDIISLECNISQNTYLNLIQEEDGTYLFQIFQRKSL